MHVKSDCFLMEKKTSMMPHYQSEDVIEKSKLLNEYQQSISVVSSLFVSLQLCINI